MTMQKTVLILTLLLVLLSCGNNKNNIPDVSGIKADIQVQRFDRDFFSIDTNNILAAFDQLYTKYPVLTPIFIQNILGLDSLNAEKGARQFLQLSKPINDRVNTVFKNTDGLEKEFEKAFRFSI